MDKNLNFRIYNELDRQLSDEDNVFSQRKILHTRILKLSAKRSQNSYLKIGRDLLDSGQFQKSLFFLKRVTIIEPDDPDSHTNFAKALLKLERENEALSYLKKALCLYSGDFDAHSVVIERFKERERLGDIGVFYQEIADLLPGTNSLAYLYLGSAESLVRSNEYPKAFEMYQKAFEAHPMQSEHHYQYAVALYHEGLFEEAIVQFGHARDLNPTDRLAINAIAHLHYCQGRLQKAFEEFEKILENGLVSASTYSNFILLLSHMGKDEEVIGRYRDLLQQNLGGNRPMLRTIYKESSRITRAILEKVDIDEETREFNSKKIKGLDLVLSFIN